MKHLAKYAGLLAVVATPAWAQFGQRVIGNTTDTPVGQVRPETVLVNRDGTAFIGGGSSANSSVGPSNTAAPAGTTQVGSQDGTGKLQPASATNPIPVNVISGGGANASVGSNGSTASGSNTAIGYVDSNNKQQTAGTNAPLPALDYSHVQPWQLFTGALANSNNPLASASKTTVSGGEWALSCKMGGATTATFYLQYVDATNGSPVNSIYTCTTADQDVHNIEIASGTVVRGYLTGSTTTNSPPVNVTLKQEH